MVRVGESALLFTSSPCPLSVNPSSYLSALGAHYAPYAWFAAIWTIPLAAACALALLRPSAAERAQRNIDVVPLAWFDASAAVAVALFIAGYAFLILYHQDLVGIDYAQLTARRFVSVPISPDNGRFFPLGLQEYNVLGAFGVSAGVYHAFSILELIVVIACVYWLLDDAPVWLRCAAIAFLSVLPAFVHVFFGLVLPERDMIVFLLLWILCLRAFDRGGRPWAFCGALVAAQFVLYYKEPAFVLVGAVVGARLVLAGRSKQARALELAHLALCAVFLVVYYVAIARHVQATYLNPNASDSLTETLRSYAWSNVAVAALAMVPGVRLALAATGRAALDPLWDALAIGAIAYAAAYVKLGLVREYYLAPSDVVSVLYLTRVASRVLRNAQRSVVVAASIALAWSFARNVSMAALDVLVREEFVDANVALASFLEHRAAERPSEGLSLYFPQTGGFQLMELSAFLRHRGLQTVTIKSPHRYPEDRCQPSQDFRCHFEAAPTTGDLVVFPPGRAATERELATGGRELFHHRPSPTPVQKFLHVLAPSDALAERSPAESIVLER